MEYREQKSFGASNAALVSQKLNRRVLEEILSVLGRDPEAGEGVCEQFPAPALVQQNRFGNLPAVWRCFRAHLPYSLESARDPVPELYTQGGRAGPLPVGQLTSSARGASASLEISTLGEREARFEPK
jgi:hypothetical protein